MTGHRHHIIQRFRLLGWLIAFGVLTAIDAIGRYEIAWHGATVVLDFAVRLAVEIIVVAAIVRALTFVMVYHRIGGFLVVCAPHRNRFRVIREFLHLLLIARLARFGHHLDAIGVPGAFLIGAQRCAGLWLGRCGELPINGRRRVHIVWNIACDMLTMVSFDRDFRRSQNHRIVGGARTAHIHMQRLVDARFRAAHTAAIGVRAAMHNRIGQCAARALATMSASAAVLHHHLLARCMMRLIMVLVRLRIMVVAMLMAAAAGSVALHGRSRPTAQRIVRSIAGYVRRDVRHARPMRHVIDEILLLRIGFGGVGAIATWICYFRMRRLLVIGCLVANAVLAGCFI